MKKQIFASGLEIRSKDPVDERLYVNAMTSQELSRVFSATGKYASKNSVLFDRQSRKFYQLDVFSSDGDSLNPGHWKTVGSESIYFTNYINTETYGLGAAIVFTDTFNYTSFYLGLGSINANENPQNTPSKWYDLRSASSGSASVYYQIFHRLNPNEPSTFTLEIDIPAQVSDNGTQYPHVEVFGDFGERLSSNIQWEKISCDTKIYVVGGVMKAFITLKGNFDNFEFDALNSSQYNINVIIK